MEATMAKKYKQHLYVGEIIKRDDGEYEVMSVIFKVNKKKTKILTSITWKDCYLYYLERLSDRHRDIMMGSESGIFGTREVQIIKMTEERLWNL